MDSDSDSEIIRDAAVLSVLCAVVARPEKTPLYSNPHAGQEYIDDLLHCGNERRIYRVLRMTLPTFYALRDWCLEHTQLCSSKTRKISIEEKLVMFLWTMNEGASNRVVQERFSHSGETVSRCFHEVLDALVQLHAETVRLPDESTPLASRIADDPKYATYFADCLGAPDGTHIPVSVAADAQIRYRNRKGELSQNVLAVCNFDMEFTYILAGWEGSAHDGYVLRDAQYRHGFQTPKGKWLGDAGYSNTETVLTPYRSVRYHLKEQYKAQQKPQNAKELFNLRHSSLRNVIERIFGVLKKKYKVLQGSEYSVNTQVRIVLVLTGLHNFVRRRDGERADELLEFEPERDGKEDINPVIPTSSNPEGSSKAMDRFRDELADRMWSDYQRYLRNYGV